MEQEQIKTFASKITYTSAKVEYKTGEIFVGFFQNTSKSVELSKQLTQITDLESILT